MIQMVFWAKRHGPLGFGLEKLDINKANVDPNDGGVLSFMGFWKLGFFYYRNRGLIS